MTCYEDHKHVYAFQLFLPPTSDTHSSCALSNFLPPFCIYTYFHYNFVSTKNNRNVLTHPTKAFVPHWHILVSQACSNIKHDNCTLLMNIVTIPEATKILLPNCVPTKKVIFPIVCEKIKRMELNTNGRLVFLLKLHGKMTLHEIFLPSSSITNNNELEARVINVLTR